MQECSNREVGDDEELAFNLVDAFSVPRFTYCEERKKYIADEALGRPGPKLFAGKDSGESWIIRDSFSNFEWLWNKYWQKMIF